jgi:predicted acetyltransferase
MAYRLRTVRDLDEFRTALGAIGHYFGWQPAEDEGERFSKLLPFERMHTVLDDGAIVAGAGVFPLELTVPGGPVRCAGVTVVGVLPTHRRRGLLTRMMNAQLEDVRGRGEPIAALWASEETIYGRYGYGLASLENNLKVQREWAGLRHDLPEREGRVRLVDHDEAIRAFPRIHERVRRRSVGFLSRTRDWWEQKPLQDRPERRFGAGPLNRALLERDGRPVAYALYRIVQESTPGEWKRNLRVIEAIGVDGGATRDIWRFLLEIDWTSEIHAHLLPVDHPLQLLVARINRLRLEVRNALWVRLLNVEAALAARRYAGDGRATVEVVSDPQFPENVGSWTIDDSAVRRGRRQADVRVDVQALASVYLGGFTFTQLARAARAEEASRGGLARADAVFRTDAAPWCPEIF